MAAQAATKTVASTVLPRHMVVMETNFVPNKLSVMAVCLTVSILMLTCGFVHRYVNLSLVSLVFNFLPFCIALQVQTLYLWQNNFTNRRYEYIEYENGKVLGKKRNCQTTKVDSWWRYVVYHCSYCMCLCDEEGPHSDRFFSLRHVVSDIANNKYVSTALPVFSYMCMLKM